MNWHNPNEVTTPITMVPAGWLLGVVKKALDYEGPEAVIRFATNDKNEIFIEAFKYETGEGGLVTLKKLWAEEWPMEN